MSVLSLPRGADGETLVVVVLLGLRCDDLQDPLDLWRDWRRGRDVSSLRLEPSVVGEVLQGYHLSVGGGVRVPSFRHLSFSFTSRVLEVPAFLGGDTVSGLVAEGIALFKILIITVEMLQKASNFHLRYILHVLFEFFEC